jgi:hypothetical protein
MKNFDIAYLTIFSPYSITDFLYICIFVDYVF